ncbi:MAG: hypothetical protein J6Y93_03765 [Treponema sp.]|nr:hypothetical protein [Treponema sp.]
MTNLSEDKFGLCVAVLIAVYCIGVVTIIIWKKYRSAGAREENGYILNIAAWQSLIIAVYFLLKVHFRGTL